MTASPLLGGIGRAFSSRNYRIYWWGHLNLTLGSWVYRLAVAWIAWELTESLAWLGAMGAAAMIPVLVFCPIGGVTTDRWSHRGQLMVSIAIIAVGSFALLALLLSDTLTIEWLFGLTMLQGLSRAFSIPSRNALVPALVSRDVLPSAIGVNSATYHGANFTGPALGGALIAMLGVEAAVLYYALGGVIAVLSLPPLRLAPSPPRPERRASLIEDLVTGFNYTIRHGGIRMMILMVGIIALFIQPYLEMLAGVADLVHGMGKEGLAMLASASGGGSMVGGLWIAWRGRTQGLVRIQLLALFVALTAMIVFALSDILWLALVALFFTGAGMVIAATCATSLIQTSVDPVLRGRVMALDTAVNYGFPALGALIVGWAGSYFGVQAPLAASAILGLIVLVFSARAVARRRGELEGGWPG